MEQFGIGLVLLGLAGKIIYEELGINDLMAPICVMILILIIYRH